MTGCSILTITLNPTIDMTSETDLVRPTHKIRTSNERSDPGGGGINVARVVAELGGDVEALFLAGGATGALLDDLLERGNIRRRRFAIAASTRVSFTVHERKSGLEYRFVPAGPAVTAAEIAPCLEAVGVSDAAYIVASGSLPDGAPADVLLRMADVTARRGARFVLDTSGEALRLALERARVFLVKPSRGELESVVGHSLDEQGICEVALDLVRRERATMVAVTLGASGVVFADAEGVVRLPALHVPVRSAVGAGDSFLAAMTLALAEGRSAREALRFGIAAGAAAVLTPGTGLCRREDVMRLHAATADAPARGPSPAAADRD